MKIMIVDLFLGFTKKFDICFFVLVINITEERMISNILPNRSQARLVILSACLNTENLIGQRSLSGANAANTII